MTVMVLTWPRRRHPYWKSRRPSPRSRTKWGVTCRRLSVA